MNIAQNIADILKSIEESAKKLGKSLEDITVIAVTKTVDSSRALQAFEAGLSDLGENRVQEFVNKHENLKNYDIDWHIIGHLQKNKVKYIIGKVKLIHSLESLSLAEEIDKRSKQHGIVTDVLVELNIAEEESKFGIKKDNLIDFLKSVKEFENIRIVGLMTVAPFAENKEDVRWVFKEMKHLYDTISNMSFKNVEMKFLSMGMTNDYDVAIEEGANIIRIGTAIFGSRSI